MAQLWPGCPCGGFNATELLLFEIGSICGEVVNAGAADGAVDCGATVFAFPFKGLPTGMAQSWPGCPCGGFNATELLLFEMGSICGEVVNAGATDGAEDCGAVVFAFPFKGLPTAMAQSWPGCPCGGFNFTADELFTVTGAGFNNAEVESSAGMACGAVTFIKLVSISGWLLLLQALREKITSRHSI